MPLQATSGAASQDAYGGNGVAVVPNFIEDVFSCFLYTGTGASQTITNNIDLSTKGGLTWIKGRSGATGHRLTDTTRGVTKSLESNSTAAEVTETTGLTAFGTTGFTIGADADYNTSAATYVSWTFRKQPKFFDVVTYTGASGNAVQNIAHNLGSTPAVIIVKCTDQTGYNWVVYHRSLGATQYVYLNLTNAAATSSNFWNNTAPTSTQFTVGTSGSVNGDSQQYVAYLFAHDAGGFGLTGTDNVISCGSFTTDGSASATVNLGYEPQYVMIKSSSATGNWFVIDNMRGFSLTKTAALQPNLSNAEIGGFGDATYAFFPTATGFESVQDLGANTTYIYIAIRRGPMKVPTTGTSVFSPNIWTGNSTARSITGTNFSPDLTLIRDRSDATGYSFVVNDKLRGPSNVLRTFNTDSESTGITQGVTSFNMDGISLGTDNSNYGYNRSSNPEIGEFFARAPSFMDVVCYTGTGSATTVSHNLTVVPELVINKNRDSTFGWYTCFNFTSTTYDQNTLSTTNAANTAVTYGTGGDMFSAKPTTTGLPLSAGANNLSAKTYVSYLFSTCSGVSKVGSYTGTGTTLQINCGFTAGARFVLIKRTDSTGAWYVWDTARGIVSGDDPYLLLNSTAAEVTNTDYIDPYSAGFEISSTAPAAINASGGTYIFLAIA